MSTLPYLRPLGIGDILDQAISLYRKNFTLLIGIVAFVEVPLVLLQLCGSLLTLPALRLPQSNSDLSSSLFVFGSLSNCVAIVLALVGYVVQISALSVAAAARYMGQPITIKETYRQTLRHIPALLVASVLLGAATLSIFVCSAFLCFIPLFVVLLPLTVRWMFTYQAIMLENCDGVQAMRRSWQLVTGYFWRALTIGILLLALYYLLSLGPTYLLLIIAFALNSAEWAIVASGVAGSIISALVLPVQLLALTVLYFDLRVRKEGYDLQLRAQQLALSPALEATA